MTATWRIEPARPRDAAACASVLNAWIDATDWVPRVHAPDEIEAFLQETVVPQANCWVAQSRSGVCGFAALDPGDGLVMMLYLAPAARGLGIGRALLSLAKSECPRGLGLWTFVANTGARRFYEREGFREVARTDGDNEEGLPDILFRWNPEEPCP